MLARRRALFLGWLLPAVGLLNVRIAFNQLWPAAVSGELQKEHEYFGYDKRCGMVRMRILGEP